MDLEPAKLRQVPGYEIQALLGEGGMGCVYRAREVASDRLVALKIVFFDGVPEPRRDRVRARFERESRMVLALDHPYLVKGYAADASATVGWLAMEFVEGRSLADMIKDGRRLPIGALVVVLSQLAEALRYMQERKIVHRDIKPANVIVDRSGVAKLCDFGLSRSNEGLDIQLTMCDVPLGTIYTMPPEQVQQGHEADTRSDLYALGATAFWALTGNPVFTGENLFIVLGKILKEPTPALAERRPDIDARLSAIVERLLAKDPAARYQLASELGEALDPIRADLGLAAPETARTVLAHMAGVMPWPKADAARRDARPARRAKLAIAAAGTRFERELADGESFRIGRHDADLELDERSVSRSHCRFELGPPGVVVRDLGSANGTWINGRAIKRALLRPGDHVVLGQLRLEVDLTPAEPPERVQLHCEVCEADVSLAAIPAGEAIPLEEGFICPACRGRRSAAVDSIEQRAADRLTELGYRITGKLTADGSAAPTFTIELEAPPTPFTPAGGKIDAAVRVVDCGNAEEAQEVVDRARRAAKLRHAGVAPPLDVSHVEDLLFITTKIERSWQMLAARLEERGRLPATEVLAIGCDVARALDAAAQAGFVHGDLSPETIFIDRSGQAHVTSLGLGLGAESRWPAHVGLSAAGTPSHVAPELLADTRATDARSDVYALGATLFHALTGDTPARLIARRSQAGTRSLVVKSSSGHLTRPDYVAPGEIKPVLARCLEWAPDARYQSMKELLAALEAAFRELTRPTRSGFHAVGPGAAVPPAPVLDADTRKLDRTDLASSLRHKGLLDYARGIGVLRRSGCLRITPAGDAAVRIFLDRGRIARVDPPTDDPVATARAALSSGAEDFDFDERNRTSDAGDHGLLDRLIAEIREGG